MPGDRERLVDLRLCRVRVAWLCRAGPPRMSPRGLGLSGPHDHDGIPHTLHFLMHAVTRVPASHIQSTIRLAREATRARQHSGRYGTAPRAPTGLFSYTLLHVHSRYPFRPLHAGSDRGENWSPVCLPSRIAAWARRSRTIAS